jgi:hypothetical protein
MVQVIGAAVLLGRRRHHAATVTRSLASPTVVLADFLFTASA